MAANSCASDVSCRSIESHSLRQGREPGIRTDRVSVGWRTAAGDDGAASIGCPLGAAWARSVGDRQGTTGRCYRDFCGRRSRARGIGCGQRVNSRRRRANAGGTAGGCRGECPRRNGDTGRRCCRPTQCAALTGGYGRRFRGKGSDRRRRGFPRRRGPWR